MIGGVCTLTITYMDSEVVISGVAKTDCDLLEDRVASEALNETNDELVVRSYTVRGQRSKKAARDPKDVAVWPGKIEKLVFSEMIKVAN